MFDYKTIVFLLVLVVLGTRAAPAQDVQIVESTIREVRAAAPDDLLLAETSYGHDYGADDEDSVGYLKRSEDGGSDGYQHFDSYHKKDGDKYGYEKHTSFGKANNAEYDAGDKAEGDDKASYKVSEELNEGDEESEGYEDDGDSEKYSDGGEAKNSGESYTEGGDDGAGAHYTGEHFEYDDGDSAKYTEAAADDESGAEEADDYFTNSLKILEIVQFLFSCIHIQIHIIISYIYLLDLNYSLNINLRRIISAIKDKKMLSNLIRSCTSRFHLIRSVSNLSAAMADIADKFPLPDRYKGATKSVWVEYIQLAQEHKPLNLGQGFPDFAAPDHVTQALANVAKSNNVLLQQYTRGFGHPRLIAALSKLYSQLINREIDPMTEILVTSGAYEALFSAIMGHVDSGDEVIIIEPFFDCYEPMVRSAGGIPKFIPLKPKKTSGVITSNDWVLDKPDLEKLFNKKTKMIILNTPNNPLGKVFNLEELQMIADLCKKWNVLCISDEVYEWMVYKPNKHIRFATLPGMWERTITIGSAGKTFSVTGWKTGWAYGPANLMRNLQMVHQNCVYTCCTPVQEAVAQGFETELQRLGQDDCYFISLPRELEAKRNFMLKFLTDVGMTPIVPDGGYFMIADWSPLESKVDLGAETDKYRDYRFTKWMIKNVGLQGIPPTAFYSEEHKPLIEDYVRYCFIKNDENLEQAAEILNKWKNK